MSLSSDDNDTVDLDALRGYVTKVLPKLPETVVERIVEKALELGIDRPSDFQYITKDDFIDLNIKVIHLRKLMGASVENTISSNNSSNSSSVSDLDLSGCSSASGFSSDSTVDYNVYSNDSWASNFSIPWSKMPNALLKALKKHQRPRPSLRREMIRIVVDEIMTFSTKPGRKHLKIVASKVVNEYPESFQDQLDGVVIGRGYESMLAQIECRVGNICRKVAVDKDNADVYSDTCSSKTKKYKYGSDWQPELPEGENPLTQKAKMEEMKEMHLCKDWDVSVVNELLEKTYPTLRSIINENRPLMDIKEDWPFLFETFGMLTHFNQLVGINLQDTIIEAFDSHVPRLHAFLCTKQKVKSLRAAFSQIEKAKKAKGTSEPEVLGILYLIAAYLGEDITFIIRNEDDTVAPDEVETETLPITPCIICQGSSPFMATNYLIALDGKVIFEATSAIKALCLVIASYYNFNIEYPLATEATMELIDRCFLGIGTSKQRKKKRVNTKVLSLINGLKDFESE